jgi:hypothetical protein
MRIDSSGNLGLGVTPSAWSLGKAIEVGFTGKGIWANNQNEVIYPNNAYFNSGWKYSVSSYAPSQYAQRDGLHAWSTAASGTAGNAITFTQAMTLDASGNLGIGTTSPTSKLSIESALAYGGLSLNSTGGTSGRNRKYIIQTDTIGDTVNGVLAFYDATASAYRMVLDSSGNVGIGTTSPSYRLDVSGFDATARINASVAGGNSALRFLNGTGNNASILFGDTDDDDTGGFTYVHSDNSLRITVNAAERARITSAGTVGINTTSPDAATVLTIKARSGENGMAVKAGTNGNYGIYFNNTSDSTVGGIIINASTTTYATSSDYRLKENVAPMTGALAKVLELNPVTYTWKADDSAGEGFIAHELQEVAPYAVTGEKDGEKMQGVDYGKLTPILTAALQEAIAEIQSLKARIAVLEAK